MKHDLPPERPTSVQKRVGAGVFVFPVTLATLVVVFQGDTPTLKRIDQGEASGSLFQLSKEKESWCQELLSVH